MAANIYSAFIIIKLLLYFEVSLLHVASISMQFFSIGIIMAVKLLVFRSQQLNTGIFKVMIKLSVLFVCVNHSVICVLLALFCHEQYNYNLGERGRERGF